MITSDSGSDFTFVQCRLLLLLESSLFVVDDLLGLFVIVTAMLRFFLLGLKQQRNISLSPASIWIKYLIFVRFFAITMHLEKLRRRCVLPVALDFQLERERFWWVPFVLLRVLSKTVIEIDRWKWEGRMDGIFFFKWWLINLCTGIQKKRREGVKDTSNASSKENCIWSCPWDLTVDLIRSMPIFVDHGMHVPRPFGFLSKDIIPKILIQIDAEDLENEKERSGYSRRRERMIYL
jgi:hypothetical protein